MSYFWFFLKLRALSYLLTDICKLKSQQNKVTEVRPAFTLDDNNKWSFTSVLLWLQNATSVQRLHLLSYYPLAEEDLGFLSLRHAKSNILEAFSRRLVSRVENYLALYSYQDDAKNFDMKGRSYRLLLTCSWTGRHKGCQFLFPKNWL